ncbi:response regulator transcription factor, partial [Candidatus Roizmanbacteria bacterium]|nr:response regulator transcription factor [Candidatus Roizmanbacteria bacterium]
MKILVVEDEKRIADSIKKGLEQEKYIVDVAYSGNDGYDLASTEKYDLIILDIMLPEISGIEICQSLRKENNSTPILMLTAKGQIHEKVEGLNSGADDYLTKPFSFDELLARIKALTRRKGEMINVVLSLSDLTLNTETYEVKRGKTPIMLSNKEYMLLEYLLRHPNQILTKDKIITQVWDYESEILPNTVEAHIKKLRDKIDVPFKNQLPLIKTVRG